METMQSAIGKINGRRTKGIYAGRNRILYMVRTKQRKCSKIEFQGGGVGSRDFILGKDFPRFLLIIFCFDIWADKESLTGESEKKQTYIEDIHDFIISVILCGIHNIG